MNTREPTAQESAIWERFQKRFETSTGPKVKALVLLANVGKAAANEYTALTGKRIEVIDAETAANVQELGRLAQILENEITGVLLKKYAVQVEGDELAIVGVAADEGDIFPAFSGFGIVPILIAAGIAAVTLLGGGFIALKMVEKRSQVEALKITERLTKIDAAMMNEAPEKREQWKQWKAETGKQVAAATKDLPGATGWLSKFLGEKGAGIAIAGILAIAAVYFLIPQFRRN